MISHGWVGVLCGQNILFSDPSDLSLAGSGQGQ
jgi:hypothetical protein